MTDAEFVPIKARVAAATSGPWHVFKKWRVEVWDKNDFQVADIGYLGDVDERMQAVMEADAAFIAHAREDIPALLDEVERLRACEVSRQELVELVSELAAEAWHGQDAPYYAAIRRIMEKHKRHW